MGDRYAIEVKNPNAKCTRNCMGTMHYDGACDFGCCDDGYPWLDGLPDLPLDPPCERHEHTLITPENEAQLVYGMPFGKVG